MGTNLCLLLNLKTHMSKLSRVQSDEHFCLKCSLTNFRGNVSTLKLQSKNRHGNDPNFDISKNIIRSDHVTQWNIKNCYQQLIKNRENKLRMQPKWKIMSFTFLHDNSLRENIQQCQFKYKKIVAQMYSQRNC